MSEQEFHTWLKTCNLQESNSQYTLKKLALKTTHQGATKTIVLPLSIENNATITGTAAILEHFGQEFNIHVPMKRWFCHMMNVRSPLTLQLPEGTMNSCIHFKNTRRKWFFFKNT